MTYTTNLIYDPDKYHYSYVRDLGSTGIVSLTVDDLHLPDRSIYIVIDVPPDFGVLQFDGVTIQDAHNSAVPDQISKADIAAGRLTWNAQATDQSLRLNFDYYAFDSQDEVQSMLYDWLPVNLQPEPTEEIDAGDFDTGITLGGVPSDGGDFASGTNSIELQSYDGGDFNSGRPSYPIPPDLPIDFSGPLSVIDPDTLDFVEVDKLPSIHELFPSDAEVFRYEFGQNYTIQNVFTFKKRIFKGYNYGSVVPHFGFNADYGTIGDPAPDLDLDFNNIVGYVYPYRPSRVFT